MKKIMVMAMAVSAFAAAQAIDVDFLRELVAIPSVSADIPQVNRAVRTMKAYLEKRGVYCSVETTLRTSMCKTLGKDIPFDRMVSATDARCFVSCGVPIAIIGTEGGSAHGADEWDSLSSMDDMKKVLIDFLTQEAKRP